MWLLQCTTASTAPGGECLPCCLATLRPHDLATHAQLTAIRVAAFSAGRVPHADAQRMATAAAEAIQDELQAGRRPIARGAPAAMEQQPRQGQASGGEDTLAASDPAVSSGEGGGSGGGGGGGGRGSSGGGVRITMDVTREGEATAVGDGGGLLLVAESDAGRVWGASALWERGVPPGSAGRAAAEELMEALESGAAVDQW